MMDCGSPSRSRRDLDPGTPELAPADAKLPWRMIAISAPLGSAFILCILTKRPSNRAGRLAFAIDTAKVLMEFLLGASPASLA